MKLIHTSDWHFGKNAPVIETYAEDQRYFINALNDIIRGEDISAVLVSGDIYDSAKVGAEAIQLYSDAASGICIDLRRDMIVTAGNHDSVERLTACDALLERAGLHIRGRIGEAFEPILLDGGKVAVYALPFFQPAAVASALHRDDIHTMTEAVTAALDCIREHMDTNRVNILMAHLAVTGAELSESDRSARNADAGDGDFIGGSSSVSAQLFEGFDYVALGHIHKPQKLGENICYSGSPIAYSFGREENQEKGVFIYDTETKTAEFRAIPQKHERKSVTCTCQEARAMTGFDNTYLKLTLSDRVFSIELRSELEQRFPYLMQLEGQRSEDNGVHTLISGGDIKELEPRDVLSSFLKERFSTELEDDLAEMFMECYESALKED